MYRNQSKFVFLLSVVSALFVNLLFVSKSYAQFDDALAAGAGVKMSNNNRIGNTAEDFDGDDISELVPVGYLIYGPIMITDKGLELNIIRSLPFALYLVGNIHGENYQNENFSEVGRSIFLGGGIRIYPLSIFTLTDVQGESRGQITRAQLQAPFRLGPALIIPTIGMSEYSQDYTQHYYGVTSAQSTSEFATFTPEKGKDTFYNLKIFWKLIGNWELFVSAESREFSEEITNSPTVVDDESVISYTLGVDYVFF